MRFACVLFASVGLATLGRVAQSAPLVYERFENSAVGTISGGVTFTTDVIGPVVDSGSGPVANQYTAVFDGAAGTFVSHGTGTQVTSTDFTVEAFINSSAVPNWNMIASDWSESGNHRVWSFIVTNTGALRFDVSPDGVYYSGNALYSPADLIEANKWYHVAAVSQGSTSRIYVDGVELPSLTRASPGIFTGDAANLKIGNTDGWGGNVVRPFAGRIDELRITESSLGRAGFLKAARTRAWVRAEDGTPGTLAGTVLNTDAGPDGTASGGVSYSSDVPIPGIAMPGLMRTNAVSLAFDGNTGTYVEFGPTLDVEPGPDGGFTVEAFVKPGRIDVPYPYSQIIAAEWADGGTPGQPVWTFSITSDGGLRFDTSPDGAYHSGNKATTAAGLISQDEWHHVAAVYDDTYTDLYVDYERVAHLDRATDGLLLFDSTPLRLGGAHGFGGQGHEANFQGLIDEFRITSAALGPGDFLRVPEPGSLALLAVGLVGLLLWRRRR